MDKINLFFLFKQKTKKRWFGQFCGYRISREITGSLGSESNSASARRQRSSRHLGGTAESASRYRRQREW